ncbi:MAG: AmmeMemoRadiSam system protein B [Ideonella sp.]
MSAIRLATLAGLFHPADCAGQASSVQPVWCAPRRGDRPGAAPKLLIVPHAGQVFARSIAGRAYARLGSCAAQIRRVVLLGPSRQPAMRGLAVPSLDAFDTPLGRVPIDAAARDALNEFDHVVRDDRPHTLDQLLEIQLPLLQAALGKPFALLPIAVGQVDSVQVAQVLERLWGGAETLFVVSTNLSRDLPYEGARCTDRMTVSRLLDLATDFDPFEACGARALNGAMMVARQRRMHAELIDQRNSGDTGGARHRVVGYAALSLTEPLAFASRAKQLRGPDSEPGGDGRLSRSSNRFA